MSKRPAANINLWQPELLLWAVSKVGYINALFSKVRKGYMENA